MPGTVRGEMWTMDTEDALVLLALSVAELEMLAASAEVVELRRAAQSVVELRAKEIVQRYTPRVAMQVIRGGKG